MQTYYPYVLLGLFCLAITLMAYCFARAVSIHPSSASSKWPWGVVAAALMAAADAVLLVSLYPQ